MTENQLVDILKYNSNQQLLVVNAKGILIIVRCPFKVKVLYHTKDLLPGQIVLVFSVKVTIDIITVFNIEGIWYYYFHFDIIL